jgi:hypothetical protein
MRRKLLAVIVTCLALSAAAAEARAQTTTGSITGVVRDTNGGLMPGVAVKAIHGATNAEMTTVTNAAGLYVLRGLPVGRYTVVTEISVFRRERTPTWSFV